MNNYPILFSFRWKLMSICFSVAIPSLLLCSHVSAESLEDLLAPASDSVLVDEGSAKAWSAVVDAFRRNDLIKARELGKAFLEGEHKTTPYQLLGVRVMIDLANEDSPAVTEDVALTGEMKRLMSERDGLRVKYTSLQEQIRNAESRINKLTANRTQAVQAGTAAHLECVRADQEIARANAELEVLNPQIEANKKQVGKVEVGTNENLKTDTLKLLDMLIEADEIEAAFAIVNVFIRVAGSDLDIAKKQQDVVSLREDQQKAGKLVSAIQSEIEPLLVIGKGTQAEDKLQSLIAKVEASDQKESVKKMTVGKLRTLDVRISVAKKQENQERVASALESEEIAERLDTLESKLEKAQAFFGTVVRSIDGFSDFESDFKAETDKENVAATLREKVRSGVVSKEKVDNLIKAKSDHAGILSEVVILQSESSSLTVVQKGRLANLRTTAETAMELLKAATP